MERRANHCTRAHLGQTFDQQGMALRSGLLRSGVVTRHPRGGGSLIGLQFVIGRVVQLACEHLLFGAHRAVCLHKVGSTAACHESCGECIEQRTTAFGCLDLLT